MLTREVLYTASTTCSCHVLQVCGLRFFWPEVILWTLNDASYKLSDHELRSEIKIYETGVGRLNEYCTRCCMAYYCAIILDMHFPVFSPGSSMLLQPQH